MAKNNKKDLIIIVIICVFCSLISFFVGYFAPCRTQDSRAEQPSENEIFKYAGLYSYTEGSDYTAWRLLNKDGTCSNNKEFPAHYASCTWTVDNNKIIINSTAIESSSKTVQECIDNYKNYQGEDEISIAFPKDGDIWNGGYECIVYTNHDTAYDILDDGLLITDGYVWTKVVSL